MNGNGRIDLERGMRTPVEVQEKAIRDIKTDVGIPIRQAGWVAASAMLACFSGVLAIRAIGPMVFWMSTAIVGAGTFLWALYVGMRYENAIVPAGEGETEGWRFCPFLIVTGSLFAAIVGGVGLSIWKVASMVFTSWPIPYPLVNFILCLPFVGSLVFLFLAGVAFTQELAMRSYFIEQAIGDLLTQEKPPWFYNGRPKEPPRDMPTMYKHTKPLPPVQAQAATPKAPRVPTDEQTLLERFLTHAEVCQSLTRDDLTDRLMPDGSRLGQKEWKRCIDALIKQNCVEQGGNGYTWTPGCSAAVALSLIDRPTPP